MNDLIRAMILARKSGNSELLNLLFINHRHFPDFKMIGGKHRLCIIEITNHDHRIQETCFEAKSGIIDKDIILNLAKSLGTVSIPSMRKNSFDNLAQIPNILSNLKFDLVPFLDQKTKNAIMAIIAEPIIEKWQMQNELLRNRKLIQELKKINSVKLWIQIGICPQCPDFQLIVGEINHNLTKCPRCGQKQCNMGVYVFDEDFSKWKLDDNDLPHFISDYISHKTAGAIKPLINKKLNSTEIDCYIPKTKLGIECKQYVNNRALSQETDQLMSDLKDQISKYFESGIKRFVLIANIQDAKIESFKNQVLTKLDSSVNFELMKFANNPIKLIEVIDEEISVALAQNS